MEKIWLNILDKICKLKLVSQRAVNSLFTGVQNYPESMNRRRGGGLGPIKQRYRVAIHVHTPFFQG